MIKKRLISLSLAILLLFIPTSNALVLAEGSTDTTGTDTSTAAPDTTTTPPATQGPTSPPGASGDTYHYNPATGLWENDYYTWDPVTKQSKPKTAQTYSYNPATGMWDTTEWVYDAPSGKYIPNVVSIKANNQSNNIDQTGPGSNNNANNNSTNSGTFDLFYNASISNSITANSASGDAAVTGNTNGGNALSGDALTIANIINMINVSFGLQPASNLVTFEKNIDGDVTGDIYIDPSQISNTGPLSVNNSTSQTDNNLTVNVEQSGQITNDVNLNSTSGSATVSGNTSGGNATSGNADAVANIVNIINSAIAAGQSFLGVININGNLNGDILLPPDFLEQLIASSAPHATVTISNTQNNSTTANLNSTQSTENNTNLNAATGNAAVSGNTSGGNASSGNAATNLTIFNLTGRQVVGANSLMVFVNVLGQWVGMIVDAPAGSNTAAFCGGSCEASSTTNNTVTVNENSKNTIENNLDINSQTGNATVAGNTSGGDATSGNATASANILNINNSNFGLTGWFGILFINVLGSWHGSFGLDTEAGKLPETALGGGGTTGDVLPLAPPVFQVFRFVPGDEGALFSNSSSDNQNGAVMGTTNSQSTPTTPIVQKAEATVKGGFSWTVPVVTFGVLLAIFGGISTGEYMDSLRARMISRKMNNKTLLVVFKY